MTERIPGVWFHRQPNAIYAGAVVILREKAPSIASDRLADRIREYGITPAMCEPVREVDDRLMILVRGRVPSTNAEVQDLYQAKLLGHTG